MLQARGAARAPGRLPAAAKARTLSVVGATATLVRVEPGSRELAGMAEHAAERHAVSPRGVLVRLLLHLPRVAEEDGTVEAHVAAEESDRLARELAAATAAYSAWTEPPREPVGGVAALALAPVEEAAAQVVLERFHYLGSFRRGSDHLGGFVGQGADPRLAALLTLSALDVPTIAERLPAGVEATDVAVLSRVFAFDWAPRNTLSFLMARVTRELRRRAAPPRLLVTYLNPNLGFTGASYRAANWALWGREAGTRYAYLDGRYTTDRELVRSFGTAEPDALVGRLGARIRFSRMPLRPLDVYACALDPGLRGELEGAEPIPLRRPMP